MAEVDFDEERRLAQELFPVEPPMPSAPVTGNVQPSSGGGFMVFSFQSYGRDDFFFLKVHRH